MIMLLAIGSFAHAAPASSHATSQGNKHQSISLNSEPASNDSALIPIPEPSAASLILLGVGAGGLACMMRKQA